MIGSSSPSNPFFDHPILNSPYTLPAANKDANPQLSRVALKLATGAGKTTVMAMLIAWQTINAVRRPGTRSFTRGFLVCAPGLTIKDRLRVLQPNDPDSYYKSRELVPNDMLDDLYRAKIVITNYHAFKLRERMELAKGTRQLLKGRGGEELHTKETEGQMIQRVMPDLMGMKNILTINDEAHHCYRAKPAASDEEPLKGDDRKEAEKNNEAARLWISGLEAVNRKLGLSRVIDLSATPFFLRGSGYAEGTLFPWTTSDFSLMDAIESGIVKLPRVPVAENIPGDEMPMFRDLWENIRKDMPKKGRGSGGELDPLKLPTRLQTALQALYGHYEKTFKLWETAGISVPPCFIIVCQNTAISKLVYDFISGFHRTNDDDTTTLENGRLPLFRNFDESTGNPLPSQDTLLIDSEQLEAGDKLDDNFRAMAAEEIERFLGLRLYKTHVGPCTIAGREIVRNLVIEAGNAVEGHKFGAHFLVAEWEQVVDAWQLDTWEAYRDVARLGRKTGLPGAQREVLWSIFERVRAGLEAGGLLTQAGLFSALSKSIASSNKVIFDFAVVDEAQDLSPSHLRFLAALGGGRPNGLFFAGDIGQRIFQQPFSWKSLGVDISGSLAHLAGQLPNVAPNPNSVGPSPWAGGSRCRRQLRGPERHSLCIRRAPADRPIVRQH